MDLFAALSRIIKRAQNVQTPPLTSAQRAELKKLDATIRANPDRPIPHFNRARYLDLHGAGFARVVEAIRPGVRLTIQQRRSCLNARYLLEINREDWDDWVRSQRLVEANYHLAYAVASFEWALQRAPDLADWHARRAPDWDAVAALKGAAEFELQNAELPQTPDELKVLAHAIAVAGGSYRYGHREKEFKADFVAAQIYTRALQLQYRDYKPRAADFLPAARNGKTPVYKQLAFWNYVIELSPDDARLRRERACWLSLRDFDELAMTDIARAIELAPGEPALYEMRAKISPDANWWDLAPNSASKTADYLRAIELRIAAGQIDGAPDKLRARGDQLLPAIRRNRGHSHARARAFYTLAIAGAPDDATLYVARADSGDEYGDPIEGENGIYAANYRDYARALARDETSKQARHGVTIYLQNNTRRPTAHEQMEALLEARQELRDIGVAASLANAMLAEVERALAN